MTDIIARVEYYPVAKQYGCIFSCNVLFSYWTQIIITSHDLSRAHNVDHGKSKEVVSRFAVEPGDMLNIVVLSDDMRRIASGHVTVPFTSKGLWHIENEEMLRVEVEAINVPKFVK